MRLLLLLLLTGNVGSVFVRLTPRSDKVRQGRLIQFSSPRITNSWSQPITLIKSITHHRLHPSSPSAFHIKHGTLSWIKQLVFAVWKLCDPQLSASAVSFLLWGTIQMSDFLLEQPLNFYEPGVLPTTQPIVSKHYRKTQWQWFGRLLFYRHGVSTSPTVSKYWRKLLNVK